MGKNDKDIYMIEQKLRRFPPAVLDTFQRIIPLLESDLSVQFISFIECLAKSGHESVVDCLNSAEQVLSRLERRHRKSFLDLASVLAGINPDDARSYFTSGAEVLSRIKKSERARFLSLTKRISHVAGRQVLPFLIDGSQSLSELPDSIHHRLLIFTEELLPVSCPAAMEFLKNCPAVIGRIGISNLEYWFREGVRILQESEEGGIAYFRIELNRSAQLLEQLSRGVELSRVKENLGMYCTALSGKKVSIIPARSLKDTGISWTPAEEPSRDGAVACLPEHFENYPTKEENFTWYKVAITHQAGHLEFGSFDFSFQRKASVFRDLRFQLAQHTNRYDAASDLHRFFDLFDDRSLAVDIFTVLEDTRVDYLVNHQYRGLSKEYRRVADDELRKRPTLTSRPLREAFLEILIQISLGRPGEFLVPSKLRAPLRLASAILRRLHSPYARVEDSAEATIRLYQITCQVANKFTSLDNWEVIDLSGNTGAASTPLHDDEALKIPVELHGQEGDLPYSRPQEVEFRGDFKPDPVQLPTRPQHDGNGQEGSSLPLETSNKLVEVDTEIDIGKSSTDEIVYQEVVLVPNLQDPGRQNIPHESGQQKAKGSDEPIHDDSLSFFYDEWDFRSNDYKLRWCRLRQRTMNEGTPDFFEATLEEYAVLAAEIKRQFELVTPQAFRKLKRREDGEEFDLDAVVDFVGEKKAGRSPNVKVYSRRNKTERDVSTVFLLDMSSSTIEYIDERTVHSEFRYFARDYRRYLEWLQTQQARERPFKRIIDLEKEAVVLLIRALEIIGDTYAIYGFSGHGRGNVDFYVIKDLGEGFSDKVKARIDGISPMRGTRMGPAIRHATWQLERQPARSKFLFLISDGRPEDEGYGRDGLDTEYAINDTRMALLEAKRKTITPFCLTVDRAGHDYLKTMCHDMVYEVVADIESLPKRLPSLYRKLTI